MNVTRYIIIQKNQQNKKKKKSLYEIKFSKNCELDTEDFQKRIDKAMNKFLNQ